MKKQTALALARSIEKESERYNAVPFAAHIFSDGAKVWAVCCQDKQTGYVFDVYSRKQWEYFRDVPNWDSDQIWKGGT